MIVKGQLEDAQFEISTNVASETPRVGRAIFDPVAFKVYIGDGSGWKKFSGESSLGDIRHSMLTEAEFQAENGNEWIIADGRDITGSDLGDVFFARGDAQNAPDLRGMYLRGKNNGRSDGDENPDGELDLGTYQADQNKAHTHTHNRYNKTGGGAGQMSGFDILNLTDTTSSSGGNEARPRSITVNIFIKINRGLAL